MRNRSTSAIPLAACTLAALSLPFFGARGDDQTVTFGPTIASISPVSASAGGPGFTLTVTGTVFARSSSVLWNGAPLKTHYRSSTQLAADVPASLIPAPGTASITVNTRGFADSNAVAFTITPAPPPLAISTLALTAGTIGQPYSVPLGASGGSPPYKWSISAGALPNGLSLDSQTGQISGTPSKNGAFNFTVQVTDSFSAKTTRAFSITIGPGLSVVTTSLPNGATGGGYSQTLSASGGTPPYVWALGSGSLPPGLSLNPGGAITGTPTAAGTFNFSVQVTDSLAAMAMGKLNITVIAGLTVTTGALPNGAAGSAYTRTLTATGGTPPYTWSSAGSLPPGLALSPAGTISGTASAPGAFTFTVQVADSAGASASKPFSITILPGLAITTAPLPGAPVGTPYSQALAATGGTPPYVWSVASGSLPPGIALNANSGAIAGTPTSAGTFNFTVQVADSTGASATKAFTIATASTLTITTQSPLPAGAIGAAYSQNLSASGGTPPYSWSIAAGALPAGLSLAANGAITGTPTRAATSNFAVQVTDSAGLTAFQTLTLTTSGSALTITTSSALPGGAAGAAYTKALAVTGGTAPYTWSMAAGALPPGLALDAAKGVISGTPGQTGTFDFTLQVTDSAGASASKPFTLVIASGLTITTPSLPAAAVGAAYAQTLAAVGGTQPYTWSITAGALPDGLKLDAAAGTISGTPGQTGASGFAVEITDAAGGKATKAFTLLVTPALTISSGPALPSGTAGKPYAQTLPAAGGTPPYAWTVSAGALPDGLSLDASGAIQGTPMAAGTFRFTAQVTDSARLTSSAQLMLSIGLDPLPALSIGGVPDTAGPLQQPHLTVALAAGYLLPVSGQLTLTFEPDAAVASDDPAIQFSSGGRTVKFTIPANATAAAFPSADIALQTGSVSGTITLTASLQAGGQDTTPSPAPSVRVKIGRAAPVIRNLKVVHTSSGFEVWITGFATSRELTQAAFQFTPAPGSDLQMTNATLPMADASRQWYQDPASTLFGSQFTLVQPFTLQGDSSAIGSVTVTLSNSLGDSQAVSASF